jgi:hypothetical protein
MGEHMTGDLCPVCGWPLRIVLRSGQRYWLCPGRDRSPACDFVRALPDEAHPACEANATASLQGVGADDLPSKAPARPPRSVGLPAATEAWSSDLSWEERRVQREAARSAQRRSAVYQALAARYLTPDADPVETYLVLSAFAGDKGVSPAFDRAQLQNVFDHALVTRGSFVAGLRRELAYALEREIEEAAQFVGYGYGDSAGALVAFIDTIDASVAIRRELEQAMICAIEDTRAVACDPNVIPLRRR